MQKLYVADCDKGVFEFGWYGRTCHYVYAHGSLENKAGFDIVCYNPNERPFCFRNDRIEDVIAVMPSGEEINARLFFWHSEPRNAEEKRVMKQDPVYLCHGLVVALNDTDAMEYAQRMCKERQRYI